MWDSAQMDDLKLAVPYRLDGANLCRFVQKFIDETRNGLPKNVTLDLARLGFIEPAGVTFLSNFIYWLNSRGCAVTLTGCDANRDAISFLDDSLFFQQHAGKKISKTASPRGTTRPLIQVHAAESYAWLRTDLIPWLSGRLGTTKASLYPLQASISELFNNIKDHSTLDIGSVFVQHFPKINSVSISVADFGRGIPNVVRKVSPELDDLAAIRKAVEPGFTSKSTPGNKGAGLDYLLTTVVNSNGGTVAIFSSNGHVLFYKEGQNVESRVIGLGGFCPGTTIEISLRTDALVHIDEEPEDLEW